MDPASRPGISLARRLLERKRARERLSGETESLPQVAEGARVAECGVPARPFSIYEVAGAAEAIPAMASAAGDIPHSPTPSGVQFDFTVDELMRTDKGSYSDINLDCQDARREVESTSRAGPEGAPPVVVELAPAQSFPPAEGESAPPVDPSAAPGVASTSGHEENPQAAAESSNSRLSRLEERSAALEAKIAQLEYLQNSLEHNVVVLFRQTNSEEISPFVYGGAFVLRRLVREGRLSPDVLEDPMYKIFLAK